MYEAVESRGSRVVSYCSIMSFVDSLQESKHFAVALKEDFSVDLYYDYRLVNFIRSDSQAVYYSIDLSFKEVFLFSINLETKAV